jgi:hypothetical protein
MNAKKGRKKAYRYTTKYDSFRHALGAVVVINYELKKHCGFCEAVCLVPFVVNLLPLRTRSEYTLRTQSKTRKSVYKMTKNYAYYFIENQQVDGIQKRKSVYRLAECQASE